MLAALTSAALAVSGYGRDSAAVLLEFRVELYTASVLALEYDAERNELLALGIVTGPDATTGRAVIEPGEAVAWAWGFGHDDSGLQLAAVAP